MTIRLRLGAGAIACLGLTFAMPAAAQGVLNVYCSVQVEWCTLLANEFQKASGIKVSITQKGSGETIAQLKAEGQSIVLVEQNIKLILDLADDVVIINTGRVVFTGAAATIKLGDAMVSGSYLVMSHAITIGMLVTFMGLMPQLFSPVATLSGLGQTVETASGSLERVNELIDEPAAIADNEGLGFKDRSGGHGPRSPK